MAKYEKYTPKQQEALAILWPEAQKYRRKADDLAKKREDNMMTMMFEENKRSREALNAMEEKYRDVCSKIEHVMTAKERAAYYFKKAKHYMRLAEAEVEMYGPFKG